MHLYTVPVVQADLRHEETIIQAANALAHLQHVIDSVFDRIDARIERNQGRIAAINRRLDAVNQLGQQLVGMKQAIRILSPAEYPSAQCADVPMTFTASDDSASLGATADYKVHTALDPIAQKTADDKLHFYHVRNDASAAGAGWRPRNDTEDGLGRQVPNFVDSVDALLLHNVGENVYADYKKADAAQRNRHAKRTAATASAGVHQPASDGDLGTAPPSISNRNHMLHTKRAAEELFYAPSSNEAPRIEMPVDLPDLPGIALNVDLSEAGRPTTITTGNAAAATTSAHFLPDLPDFTESDVLSVAMSGTTPPAPSDVPLPPPPPPAVPIDVPDVIQSAAPPPPPPPPPMVSMPSPPPPPQIETGPAKATAATPSAAPAGNINDRSNLMEAIRQAGGRKTLRAQSMQEMPSPRKEPPAASGNLMDDLHKRLALRRQGISGRRQDTDEHAAVPSAVAPPPGGVMNRISAMIPPPRQHDTSSGNSDEDDWK